MDLNNVDMDFKIDTITAMVIIGSIQLASRHPKNTGPSSQLARKVAEQLIEEVAKENPTYAAICKMGWNPDFDIS